MNLLQVLGKCWFVFAVILTTVLFQLVTAPESVSTHAQQLAFLQDQIASPLPASKAEGSEEHSELLPAPLEEPISNELVDEPSSPEIQLHTVKRGETIGKIWAKFNAGLNEAIQAEKALKELKGGYQTLRAGEVLKFELSDAGSISSVTRELPEGKLVTLVADADSYLATIEQKNIVEEQRTVSGTISTSLAEAALEINVPYAVIDEMVDLFGAKIEFTRDLQPGDTFTIVYTDRTLENGEQLPPGAVIAASITNSGEMLAAVRHIGSDGKERFYDEDGDPLGSYFLRYPVQFTRISSVFNTARFHPVLKVRRPHNGVDFAAPTGTAVRSVADGVIISAGYSRGGGNTVKIKHSDRYQTAYLHLSRISKGIRKGSRVKRGEVIGAVGMTGLATGPHLHFSLYDYGRYVDPLKVELPVMPLEGASIPKTLLVQTLDMLRHEDNKIRLALLENSRKPA
ncbi:MAG: peptidoglycan DD-metalloendopeptidase family protein [Bdellovibrionales bacterium]|nr:peptidoglycan DD-metalloendopeptidase family protein [Bdellovibrionales bacterium]